MNSTTTRQSTLGENGLCYVPFIVAMFVMGTLDKLTRPS